MPLSAKSANPVRPTATTPFGCEALDEERHRRGSDRDRRCDQDEAERHRQEGEVLAVVAHDLAEHECRRTDREHDRPQADSRGQQPPRRGIGEPERNPGGRGEEVDGHGAAARQVADDRAHRGIEAAVLLLREEEDPHEDPADGAADEEPDTEADGCSDREIAPPGHGRSMRDL